MSIISSPTVCNATSTTGTNAHATLELIKHKLTDAEYKSIAEQLVLVQHQEEEENKHVLLDRLFKFIRTEGDEQLNPVLSGYFCKLVSLLISRKQKSLVPYIFAPGSDVIEQMLKHVYQKSISEVLNKLLTQIDSDFEPEIMAEIKAKQQLAVAKLIDQLGPDVSDEHNLNGCTII